MKKGISIAILGFITIGLAVGGLMWVQYNTNLGINQKASSTEGMVFMRLNEESEKLRSYIESSFGFSMDNALSTAAKNGGSMGNETRYWQCVLPQAPNVDEMQTAVNDLAMARLNSYIGLIEESSGEILVNVEPASCINTDYSRDDGAIDVRGMGVNIKMSNRDAFVSSNEWIFEKTTGPNKFWYDYEILKKWVENDEIRKMIVKNLNDGGVMPQGLNYESCSCDVPVSSDADEVLDNSYPCWESGIKKAVTEGVNEAVKKLEGSEVYFGSRDVYCQPEIRCMSVRKPIVADEKRREYESDLCCGEACTECKRHVCAISSTERICYGESSESNCEKPDCEVDYDPGEYCKVSMDKMERPYAELDSDYYETNLCEACYALSFGLIYETDVDLTLICNDVSSVMTTNEGVEPLSWEINLFVSAISTNGVEYRASDKSGCD